MKETEETEHMKKMKRYTPSSWGWYRFLIVSSAQLHFSFLYYLQSQFSYVIGSEFFLQVSCDFSLFDVASNSIAYILAVEDALNIENSELNEMRIVELELERIRSNIDVIKAPAIYRIS